MKPKEACFLTIVLLLATSVVAYPLTDIYPVSVYENSEFDYNLTIDNIGGDKVIEEVSVSMPYFDITNIVDYVGWDEEYSNSYARWYNAEIEDGTLALLKYTAKAELVDQDTNVSINVTTVTTNNKETTNIVYVLILNDDTPPNITNNNPQDNDFFVQGTTNQEISVDAEDPETGIKEVEFSHWNCSFNTTNPLEYLVEFDCVNNTCSDTVDFSKYREGDIMCFQFEAVNNAEDSAILNGSVMLDNTPPTVNLIAPGNDSYSGSNTQFSFIADDNLASTLECEMIINGNTINSVNAVNGELTNITYNIANVSEGVQAWKILCYDQAGLYSSSESRVVVIDKTPPSIVLNSPADNSLIGDNVIIDIDVTDNYEVDSVDYSTSLNSSELPEGANTLTVNAADKAGNTAEAEFIFNVDRTAPTISLIYPANNAYSETNINFIFDIADNLDEVLNCSLYLNGTEQASQELNLTQIANVSLTVPIGDYEWYVECQDDTGNLAATEIRNVTITDLTSPDIESFDVVYVIRSEDYTVDVNITDISGIDVVEIQFNGKHLNATENGNIYSAVIETDENNPLGDYNVTVTANDTFGNMDSFTDTFTLLPDYVINLALSQSTAEPGEDVTVSGTVSCDDGGAVSGSITLYLPDETVNATITNGAFSYSFNSADEGDYTIRAVIVTAEGIEHEGTAALDVEEPDVEINNNKRSTSSKKTRDWSKYCGDGTCQTFEDYNNCPEDCSKKSSGKTYITNLEKSGYSKTLSEDDRIRFEFESDEHHVTVSYVSSDFVDLLIESDPILITVNKYETRKVDIDNDNVYDLSISLNEVVDTDADLSFNLIEEAIDEDSFAETESAGKIEEAIAAAENPAGAFIIEIEDYSYSWMKNILLNPIVLLTLAIITISRLCIFLYGKKIVINRTNSKINWDNYFDNKR
jgi:hypothetical protein